MRVAVWLPESCTITRPWLLRGMREVVATGRAFHTGSAGVAGVAAGAGKEQGGDGLGRRRSGGETAGLAELGAARRAERLAAVAATSPRQGKDRP